MIWLKTPPIEFGRTYDRSVCASALGLDPKDLLDIAPQLASAGNPNIFIAVKDKNVVDRAWLDLSGLRSIQPAGEGAVCVFVFAPTYRAITPNCHRPYGSNCSDCAGLSAR